MIKKLEDLNTQWLKREGELSNIISVVREELASANLRSVEAQRIHKELIRQKDLELEQQQQFFRLEINELQEDCTGLIRTIEEMRVVKNTLRNTVASKDTEIKNYVTQIGNIKNELSKTKSQ